MARAHYVKRARKDNPAVKAGEPYWWWNFMVGGRSGPKQYSAKPPTRAQLTQSRYLSTVYAVQDEKRTADDALPDAVTSAVETLTELRDETEGSYDNMPEGLQAGSTGELLYERVEGLNTAIDELEGMDFDFEPEQDEDTTEEEQAQDFWTEKLEEVEAILADLPE